MTILLGVGAIPVFRRDGMLHVGHRIEKGSWVVRQAVGQNTPVLLGRKLTTKYFVTDNYVEVRKLAGASRENT